jgi:CHAD domain-containing protein
MRDLSVQRYAANALAQRMGQMREQLAPVRQGKDIEALHQMRVASRRLRAALAIFADALPKAKVKRWRKQVRRVTRALGAARDADVQIAFVEQVLQQMSDRKLHGGLKRLSLRLGQRRERMQAKVEAAMDELERSALFTTMPRDLHAINVEAQMAGVDDHSDSLRRHARNVIQRRLEELLAYQQYVNQQHMVEQLHEMRIAAKRLRYTMEVFADVYGEEMERPLKHIRRVQTQLGDVHDMDMWLDALPKFLEAERKRHLAFHGRLAGFSRIAPGIESLTEHCIGERLKAYEKFRGTWGKLAKRKFWPQLRKVLKADAPVKTQKKPQPDEPTPPAPQVVTRPTEVPKPREATPADDAPKPRTPTVNEN